MRFIVQNVVGERLHRKKKSVGEKIQIKEKKTSGVLREGVIFSGQGSFLGEITGGKSDSPPTPDL